MLKPNFKKKWLKALRSNEYKQCKSYLHTSEGFCCLGVAMDIGGHEWIEPDFMGGVDDRKEFTYYHNNDEELPETDTLKGWGLTEMEADFLASMNDGQVDSLGNRVYDDESRLDRSFKEIADYIEKNL